MYCRKFWGKKKLVNFSTVISFRLQVIIVYKVWITDGRQLHLLGYRIHHSIGYTRFIAPQMHWLLQVKVKVTLRLTVSQSVCLGVEPRLRLMTRYLFMIEKLQYCPYGGALSDEKAGLSFVSHSP
jgi:hypothetical protein